jgi:hypothetical protein
MPMSGHRQAGMRMGYKLEAHGGLVHLLDSAGQPVAEVVRR